MNLSFNLAGRQQQLRSGVAGVDLLNLADDVVDGFRIGIDRLPADVREERVEADFFAPSQLSAPAPAHAPFQRDAIAISSKIVYLALLPLLRLLSKSDRSRINISLL